MTTANPLQFTSQIGNQQVRFERNPLASQGNWLAVTSRVLGKSTAIADVAKGIREACQLLQTTNQQAPFLSEGMSHSIEHWKTVSGHAFGALALPFLASTASKVQARAAAGHYDVEFSRHITELTAVTAYAAAPWIPDKAFAGAVGSVGKVLILWPQVFDLQASVCKLVKFIPLVGKAKQRDEETALKATIVETSLKVGKIVLSLFVNVVAVFSILTGITLSAAFAIAALTASLGSAILSLVAEQTRTTAPLLAI